MTGARDTPGGVGSLLAGLLMEACGAFLLADRLRSSFEGAGGLASRALVLCLLPLLLGPGLLFCDRRSRWGRWLTYLGAALVPLGILSNPKTYFEPTSLVDTLLNLTLLGGGLALVARSLRPQRPPA